MIANFLANYKLTKDTTIKQLVEWHNNLIEQLNMTEIISSLLVKIDDNTYDILSMLNDHDCSIEEMFLRLPKDAQTDDCRNNLNQLIKALNDKGIIEVYDEFCRS